MQVVPALCYIHLTNKTLQNGSNNVVHSATAHTSPHLQTEKCGAINCTQTPYVLATWQEFCQEVSFIVMCVHIAICHSSLTCPS